ncbi:SDR family oxidoreductase [Hyphococcus flavus]|uniref:SDR family oxidoreductase n=1 Tax=Hyphococcus flavus TaxID=1866326 RepID=A0AAE9ZCU9_9PROT|nr:SDR family oxidoreductase [Hyphococcus flavus]WDI30107.1 SDR family oxidoreductase [Hyphococcus flavus]
MERFSSKTVAISGGASGIGRAAAKAFSSEGAIVYILDQNDLLAEKTVAEIGSFARFKHVNVKDEAHWIGALDAIASETGGLDVLVNSAGVGARATFDECNLESWNHVIGVNLTGAFLGCKHAFRIMRASGRGGAIVNLSSVAAHWSTEDGAAYSASKGGLKLLTQSVALAAAHEKLGIRCNAVEPTSTDTELLDPMAESLGGREKLREVMGSKIPMGRMVRPEEVAAAILFLASDDASMINGIGLPVDGAVLSGMVGRYR